MAQKMQSSGTASGYPANRPEPNGPSARYFFVVDFDVDDFAGVGSGMNVAL
jgi:hypothetical protein